MNCFLIIVGIFKFPNSGNFLNAITAASEVPYISKIQILLSLNVWCSQQTHLQKQPQVVFYKKGVVRNFAKFTRKHLCQSLSFNRVADLRPGSLFKKRLWHRCFPAKFAKFLRALFLQNTSGRLRLHLTEN